MRCWYAFLVLPLAVFAIVVSCVDEPEDSQVGDSELMTATFTGNSLLAETQARVHAEQYRFRPQGKSFAGTNSAQRFSVELAADGVTVSVRKHAILYDWSWATVGFGREGALTEALPAAPADGDCALPPMYGFGDACLAMIEYDRETYIEWYSNRIGGLEQGFEVLEKTEGRGLLVIEGYVSTPLVGRVNDDMSEIVFSDQQGDVLRYSGLAAWDANGVPLDAWMEWIDPDTIRLSVDDTHAAYPITVDPGLSASPDWVAEGDQAETYFGNSVSGAGDVNADGYDDVVVGARFYDNGQNEEGRAYVFLGNAAGVQSSPVWTAESDQVSAYFGYCVSGAGDVNGDGYDDVIVGAHTYDNGQNDEGRAYVFLGQSSGVQSSPIWTGESDQADAQFGISVSGAGDVNGDGYDDVIVGASLYDNSTNNEGRAYVFLGQASGVQASATWTADGAQTNDQFGSSVSAAGDVNGDGYDDVIVGAKRYDNGQNDEGGAYVFLGLASGVQSSPAWTAESDQASAFFGWAVSDAGDVDADGYDDVVVGAALYDNGQNDEGRAYLFLGQAAGVQSSPAWIAEGDQAYAYFGFSVSGAGDVNGDGYDDVIVGSFLYDNGEANEGRAYLFFGQATVVQADLQSTAVWTAESDQNSAFFSRSVSGAGDVNNDGYDDVIVGSDHYDNDQNNEGRAYVFHGLAPTTTTTTTTTTTSSSSTTTSSSSTTTSSSSTTTTSSSSTTTTSSSSTTTTSSSSTTTTSSSSTTTTSSSSTTTTSSSSTTTTSSSSTTTTSSSSTTTSSSSSTTTTSSSSTTTTSSSSTTTTSSSSTTTSSSSSTTTTSSSSTTTTSSSSTTTTSSSSTTTTTPTTTSTTTTTAGGDDDTGDDDTGDDDTGDDDTGDDDTTDDDVDDDTGDDDTNDDDTSDDDTGGDDDDTVPLPDSDDDDDTQPGSRSSGDDDDDGGCGC